MPKINVYLPDELAAAVKDAGIPVSPICQQALQVAVRKVAALRETATTLDLAVEDFASKFPHFTQKASTAVTTATRLARRKGQREVGTGHLLVGLIETGQNMALQTLLSLDIDPDEVREELLGRMPADQESPAETETAARGFDGHAAAALKAGLAEAITLGHNYIGCEHLLLGLVSEPDGVGGEVLRARGAELRMVRRTVQAGLGGYVYAQHRNEGQQQQGAEQLRQVLGQFSQRLDAIEQRLATLPDNA
jgi:ATP-dependent Clp protease ATP-binding subunit ClpC